MSPGRLAVAALAIVACGPRDVAVAGADGGSFDAASVLEASGSIDGRGSDAPSDHDAATGDAASGGDAPGATDGPAAEGCSLAAGTPGMWRDLTPPALAATVATTTPCTDIQVDPSNRCTLYAMYGAAGLWKSTDAGGTWASIGNLPTPASLGRILVDPKDPSHLYATGSVNGSSLGFWVSHDGGSTFAIPPAFSAGAATTWSNDVYNLAADPTDFDHIVMTFHSPWPAFNATDAAGVLESTDGGVTYTPHDPPAGMDHGQGIAFLYNPALGLGSAKTWLVGAGYGAGLFRTTDGGSTFTSVSTLQENHGGFDAHYSSQGYVYIGASDGIHRSTDNGVTWESESQGMLANWTYSVIGDGKRLYSSPAFVGQPFNQPFFVSPEGNGPTEGTQWTAYGTQVIPNGPWKMQLDGASGIIYSANWSSGAWALTVAP